MNTQPEQPLDYEALRERVKSGRGREYWRSLEELADTPEFQGRLRDEFPSQEEQWIDPVARRNFLKIMGASLAFSGLTACNGFKKPNELIVPYVKQPEMMVLGKPLFFATAMVLQGFGYPVLAESHEGRPTKIEGNLDHPDSLGAAHAWMQASILNMYDPDRSQVVVNNGEMRLWADFLTELQTQIAKLPSGGAGLAVLSETITSPTLASQFEQFAKKFPNAKWVQYDPCGPHNRREGARLAFGEYVETHYKFENADVVLSLDSNFMEEGPASIRQAKAFSKKRRVRNPGEKMCRYYVVESALSCTGSVADHRLPLKPSEIVQFTRALAAKLGVAGVPAAEAESFKGAGKFLDLAAADLKASNGAAIVVPGDDAPPAVHVLAHAINAAIGAVGKTVTYTESVAVKPSNQIADLEALVSEMKAADTQMLLILGGNPSQNAPTDIEFADALKRVPFRVKISEYQDETSAACHWHIPQSHFLESWGDVRSSDGTVSIIQPLIAPLYQSRTWNDLLSAALGQTAKSTYDLVQEYWKTRLTGNADKAWRKALHDGFIAGTALKEKSVALKADVAALPATAAADIELILRPDPSILDGRFANNGWLQELPKPFTKITWDNAALMSPKLAEKLQVRNEDVVSLETSVGKVTAPVFIVPGYANGTIVVHTGFGRKQAGRVAIDETGTPHGFDAYRLWSAKAPSVGVSVKVLKVPGKHRLAQTQLHFRLDEVDIPGVPGLPQSWAEDKTVSLENRGLVRRASLEEYNKHPNFVDQQGPVLAQSPKTDLYDGNWTYDHKDKAGNFVYSWGMSIDSSVCNGCNACVTACQAENNIPVVGKDMILRHREMHWLRIDQYFRGGLDNPEVYNLPLPCMHCENAPCEVVCPVNATVHSEQATNDMIYNRCIGTRFCSNNCPYKVRRFNWFQFTDFKSPLRKMVNNPDVTVRTRGVMEKCSYCIQRISSARVEAENETRRIKDGEVVTACQATCPTDAIVFGDLNDPRSEAAKLRRNSLTYGMLVELNTKPHTTYLAAVRNENPELSKDA